MHPGGAGTPPPRRGGRGRLRAPRTGRDAWGDRGRLPVPVSRVPSGLGAPIPSAAPRAWVPPLPTEPVAQAEIPRVGSQRGAASPSLTAPPAAPMQGFPSPPFCGSVWVTAHLCIQMDALWVYPWGCGLGTDPWVPMGCCCPSAQPFPQDGAMGQ